MPAHEFLFALDLPDCLHRAEVLVDEVASALLRQVGYACEATTEMVALLHAALTQDSPHESHVHRVLFTAQAGELQIVVSYGNGREWRTRRPLP